MIFWALSLIGFPIVGTVDWTDKVFIILYCGFNYVLLFMGYHSIRPKVEHLKGQENTSFIISSKSETLFVISAILNIIICIENVTTYYSSISEMTSFLSRPAQSYEYVKFLRRHGDISEDGSFFGTLLNCFTFTKYIVFDLVLIYWKNLKKGSRIIAVSSMIIYFLHSILIGALINFGGIAVSMLPELLIVSSKSGRLRDGFRKNRKWIIIFVVAVSFLLINFMGQRNVFHLANARGTSVWLSGILGILHYISFGYNGLAECMHLPFESTFLYTTFRGIAVKLPIPNLFVYSYLYRNQMNGGQNALQSWATIFPWLASDFSFFLIPVIFFLLGRFMKRAWNYAFYDKKKSAVLMCGQMSIFAFMTIANNQLFHTFLNAVGTIVIYLLYKFEGRIRFTVGNNKRYIKG